MYSLTKQSFLPPDLPPRYSKTRCLRDNWLSTRRVSNGPALVTRDHRPDPPVRLRRLRRLGGYQAALLSFGVFTRGRAKEFDLASPDPLQSGETSFQRLSLVNDCQHHGYQVEKENINRFITADYLHCLWTAQTSIIFLDSMYTVHSFTACSLLGRQR